MGPVKIIATVGPASREPVTLRGLERAGASLFRLNCSHADPRGIEETAELLRKVVPTAAILLDLQGPKLRTGDRSLELHDGETVRIHRDDLTFDPQTTGIETGHRVLVADGQMELRVTAVDAEGFDAFVERGGSATPHRGINLPDTAVTVGPLSEQDLSYIEVANRLGIDWVALSFVRSAEDVHELRRRLRQGTGIVAKIERREALENLQEIVEAADAVMAARGDLGVEIPYEEVPDAQQRIAETALRLGKAGICATEMLESMRTNSRPTRAEVSDVAAAVTSGFGAVMLSAETATGEHPVEAVAAMRRICDRAPGRSEGKLFADSNPRDAAVSAAASALAMRTGAGCILALTFTGYSARTLSACRPPARIIAATPTREVARNLQMYWGVEPLVAERHDTIKASVEQARVSAAACSVTVSEPMVITASRSNPARPPDTIWLTEESNAAPEAP